MKAELIYYTDQWEIVNLAARTTAWKSDAKYPSSNWKRRIAMATHSPIRCIKFYVMVTDAPYYSVMHLCRHHVGFQPYVNSQRPDRSPSGASRHDLPQDALISVMFEINAQAMINISQDRLCNQADPVTQKLWTKIINAIGEREPELRSLCVKKCIRCGFCPEMKSCEYASTDMFRLEVEEYRKGHVE